MDTAIGVLEEQEAQEDGAEESENVHQF